MPLISDMLGWKGWLEVEDLLGGQMTKSPREVFASRVGYTLGEVSLPGKVDCSCAVGIVDSWLVINNLGFEW
jgi:hypothetical protein